MLLRTAWDEKEERFRVGIQLGYKMYPDYKGISHGYAVPFPFLLAGGALAKQL